MKTPGFDDRLIYSRLRMDEKQMVDLLGKPEQKLVRGAQTLYFFALDPHGDSIENDSNCCFIRSKKGRLPLRASYRFSACNTRALSEGGGLKSAAFKSRMAAMSETYCL